MAVAFIAERAAQGEKVMVHCKGGHGRGAAVAFAYLVSKHGGSLTPEEAQARLNSVRDVRKRLYLQENLCGFYRGVLAAGGSAGGRAAPRDARPREMM